ncbi:RNA polymerase sigma factor [Apibacter adventoris]|uniref:RNA polymerase sigma factor n=1 Tax=Apibacter adventoris TaxID=1679466 RepID=A0A2S8AAT9_9FLAO|nr:RNA polymerase sigma factor [Apibacter adventoris]PQL91700.1 RNA polymerase subunit sigma-70 [Apibacter adventoris]
MDDKELLFLIKENKNKGFKYLVEKYSKSIYWHIRKIVLDHNNADDVTQNVFIKVFLNLDFFKGDSSLKTWIYKIATNESINFLNSAAQKKNVNSEELAIQLSSQLEDDSYFEGEEIQLKLQQAIAMLPEKQRIVFNMKYFDDLKYEEISEILNTSVGALKSSYHHATKKIEEFLLNSIEK